MTKDRWSISLVVLNALIIISQENEINAEIEGYDQKNLQNDALQDMMVLPQDCFEVCNDYECLYLCPQPLRGVKRCITPLQSNKKNCCQNGQKGSSSGTDNLKAAGKHIWQAREQFLGIKKELENDLANRRYSLLKGLQPLALKQHSKDPLFKLGIRTSKPKSSTTQLICPVNERKVTNSPNNIVTTNDAVLDTGIDDNNESHISQESPFNNEEQLSKVNENVQISDYNYEPGEGVLSTTMVPMLRNENTGDQMSTPNSDSIIKGKEEVQNIFTDLRGNTGIIEAGRATSDTDIAKSSYYNECNSPDDGQRNNENILNQPSPFSSSDTEQLYNYDYEATNTNGGETEPINQYILQTDPAIYYGDSYRSPMEIENNLLSQTNRDDFLYTTPLAQELNPIAIIKPSKLETLEDMRAVNADSEQIYDSPLTEYQDPMITTPGSIDEQSEIDHKMLVESNNEFTSNDCESYTYAENKQSVSDFPTKESSVPEIANIEESTSLKTDVRDKKIPSNNLELLLAQSYLRSENNENQSLIPIEMNKTGVNFLLGSETYIGNDTNNLDTNENNYVEKFERESSSNNMNDNEHSYDYLNDDSLSNAHEKSENKTQLPEINMSSVPVEFQSDDKNNFSETLEVSEPPNFQKQNYTYRIIQELISRYNITSDLNSGGTNAFYFQPFNSSLDDKTSKHHLAQEKPMINPNLTSKNADKLQNKPNENGSDFPIDNTTHYQDSSKSLISTKNIGMSKLDVIDETKGESIDVSNSTGINEEYLFNKWRNKSTSNIHNSGNIPIESFSNISKSFRLNNETERSKDITCASENTPSGPQETIMSIKKGNVVDTIIGDNENGIPLNNKTANGNRSVINSSHSQELSVEQTITAASVHLVQKGSLKNSSDTTELGFLPNQTIFHTMKNDRNEKLENKNMNITENQLFVESNIQEPMFGNNVAMSNESVNEMSNSEIADQELMYDVGDSESSNINSTNHDDIINSVPIGQEFYNETDINNLYDQNEEVLRLIPNELEIPLPKTYDDKRDEIKNDGIDEVYLRLEESNESSSRNIENDNSNHDLYRLKSSDEISTELNDSESYTLEDKKNDSIINKKQLSDIINTELNNIKQETVILKKREEEEMSYGDDTQCDCDYPTSRDEELPTDHGSDPYIQRVDTYHHPVYPILIVFPVPYSVCNCENKTNHNTLNDNHINALDPYIPKDKSEPLQDHSFNSVYNNFLHEREERADRAPPYMPNLFFPFVPWGGMYPMSHPYHQETNKKFENDLQLRDATNEKLDTMTDSNGGLQNPNPENLTELHQESVSTSNTSEAQRFSRNEYKQTGINEYVFIDGQYVKVLKDFGTSMNAEASKTEETPTTVTEPSTAYTSTESYYAYTTQKPVSVQNVFSSGAMNTNENGHRPPVNYFYPSDYASAQNRLYGFYPSYFFNQHR
ncbi:homeobox protein 2-like [Halyomorpha halys]|uniref:homeobox protein 2-like n=1 Tax=Halyomorpha halys TaxID=286706 RepID=UPI0006D4C854|nr:GATA zinc finger domain-containing protein 14-like [Halyomorpha halys]